MTGRASGELLAVILAAGESRRMGCPKALLEYSDGATFLRHLADVFEEAGCSALAVLGHDAARIAAEHPGLVTVENESWREGQLSSARAGIGQAVAAGARIVIVHPVDAPGILSATVRNLLARSSQHGTIFPQYRGSPGHPLVLTSASAERVLELKGAPTLEAVLASIGATALETDDPGVVLNLNSPDDYERAFGRPPRMALRAARRPPRS